MEFFQNISTVAKYEARILRRSWFFRLFSIGAIVIFTFLNIGLFSPIGDEPWNLVSIPSSVPYVNLYLLNIAQAILVIFLAADFLKRDKKLDTNEVLYTRSVSNFEYVTGKTWGILRLFIGLNFVILAIGMLMNIISKSMKPDYASYLWYLLLLTVPTIVFSLGLAFMLMSVIRNQAVTFLVLLGMAGLDIFYLWYRTGFIFDYMAFGVPMFKSGVTGFSNLSWILNQRLVFLFSGLALVMATILLFKRLPQSRVQTNLAVLLMLLFLAAGAVCALNTYRSFRQDKEERLNTTEAAKQFEDSLFPSLSSVSIDLVHKGISIDASASVVVVNENDRPLARYLFSLNPALTVISVKLAGNEVPFRRVHQVIEADPGRSLAPGESDSLAITYSGIISEAFCYPGYTDNPSEFQYRMAMLPVGKRQAFLDDKYLLLTPETFWYPATALNYYPSNPARIKTDFTKFRLRVKPAPGLIAVSQGKMSADGDYSIFDPETPLTGMTLAIGNYRSDTLVVDSVSYIAHYFEGHDYFRNDLKELGDTLGNLVSGIMRELETSFNTKYPFSTLALVEVPVQFFSHPRQNTQTRAEVQPAMVLLPEKMSTLQNAGFRKQFTRQKKRMERNNQVVTDKELQVRIFNNFIRNTFISGENFRFVNGVAMNEPTRYRLGPSFYFFKNHFHSLEYPVMNAVFESHLQKLEQIGPRGGFAFMSGSLTENDRANLILKDFSFRDILAKNPGGDTLRIVLTIKGDWFFNFLRSRAGIEEFKSWFSAYIDENTFRSVDILKFNNDIRQKFGFEFYPWLDAWFNTREQPGFILGEPQVREIVINDRTRYQVTFVASNPERVPGIFNVAFRTGGAGPGGRGMMVTSFQGGQGGSFSISTQGRGMEASDLSRIVFLGPGETKKIGIVIDAQPRAMLINTIFTRNIPGEITIPLNDVIKEKGAAREFSGEELLATTPKQNDRFETIVDNEDPGFINSTQTFVSPLKKMLGIKKRSGYIYETIRMWNVPEYWQPVVQNNYYGKYIRSAVYTRGGNGERSVLWKMPVKEPGYYDVYCYVGKAVNRMSVRGAGAREGSGGDQDQLMAAQEGQDQFKDIHYRIFHDEGIEEISLDYENADGGWNMLGRYYISADTAKVELTNKTSGRLVIGDAIRWVRQN